MAKSTNVKLYGEIHWAKVFDSNRDMEGYEGAYEECDGAYTVNLLMDEENFQKLQATGCPKAGKKVKDPGGSGGDKYDVKFVRKHADPRLSQWPDLGGPPGVYDENGNEWDFDVDGVIPNGSIGTVLVNVYPARKTKGTRLLKIQVLEKGEMQDGDNFLEKKSGKKAEAPKTKTKPAPVKDDSFDDSEIPF